MFLCEETCQKKILILPLNHTFMKLQSLTLIIQKQILCQDWNINKDIIKVVEFFYEDIKKKIIIPDTFIQ